MFDDYKRRHREFAASRPARFTIVTSLALAIFFVAMFRNVLAGIVGGTLAALFGWYWWRPGGPGQRRYGSTRP